MKQTTILILLWTAIYACVVQGQVERGSSIHVKLDDNNSKNKAWSRAKLQQYKRRILKKSKKSKKSKNKQENTKENASSSKSKSKSKSSRKKKSRGDEKQTDDGLKVDDVISDIVKGVLDGIDDNLNAVQDDGDTTTAFRSVRIKRSEDLTQCVVWDPSDTLSPVSVVDCATAGNLAIWEIWPVTQDTFRVRHQASGQCLPENPESPDQAFDCWSTQLNQAVADSINGLVDCSSNFAAIVAFGGPSSSLSMYNTVCGTSGADGNVVLMSYTTSAGVAALWGEKLLLGLPQMESFDVTAEWFFEDIAV